MIEITTYPDNIKIYIDFAFKGIPKSLPLESIQPFIPPKTEKKAPEAVDEEITLLQVTPSPDDDDDDELEVSVQVQTPHVRERLKKSIIGCR